MTTKKSIPYPELLQQLRGVVLTEDTEFFILKTKCKARIFIRKNFEEGIKGVYIATGDKKIAWRVSRLHSGKPVLNLYNDKYCFFLDESVHSFSADLKILAGIILSS